MHTTPETPQQNRPLLLWPIWSTGNFVVTALAILALVLILTRGDGTPRGEEAAQAAPAITVTPEPAVVVPTPTVTPEPEEPLHGDAATRQTAEEKAHELMQKFIAAWVLPPDNAERAARLREVALPATAEGVAVGRAPVLAEGNGYTVQSINGALAVMAVPLASGSMAYVELSAEPEGWRVSRVTADPVQTTPDV